MSKAFFISEKYLKDNSPLSGNVDIAELYPFARTAEEIYIQEAIGTNLFDYLITALDNSVNGSPAAALSADDKTLIRKIRDCLVWYTCYDAIPFLAMKLRNIGIVKQTGDNMTSAETTDLHWLRKECKNKGDFYLKRLQDYLCANKSLYSAYKCGTGDQLDPNKKIPSSSCDIAFDDCGEVDTDYVRRWIKG